MGSTSFFSIRIIHFLTALLFLSLPGLHGQIVGNQTGISQDSTVLKTDVPASHALVWWNREIVVFRETVQRYTPAVRVEEAHMRIHEQEQSLLESPVTTDSITVGDFQGYRFLVGDAHLFTVLESDLDILAGENLKSAREQILQQMEEIRVMRGELNSRQITRDLIYSLIATALFAVSLAILFFLTRFFSKHIENHVKKWRFLKITRTDLRPHIGLLAKQAVKLGAVIASLYLLCVYLAYVFSLFPLTAPWGTLFTEKLLHFGKQILDSILAGVPGIIAIIIIFLCTRWMVRIATRILNSVGDDSPDAVMSAETSKATRRIVTVAIWLFGAVLAYPYIPGSGSDAFKGVSLLFGLMLSLGSAGMINQIMSGFVLLYSGSIRTGEYVKVGDIEGTIKEIGILAVKFITPRQEFITVPNAVVISNSTTNFSRFSEVSGVPVKTQVTIGYDTPWRQVHDLLMQAVSITEEILENPEPSVRQTELADWYPVYILTFYVRDPQTRLTILSNLNAHIQDVFNEAGVQIMSPHFRDQPEEALVVPKGTWFPGLPGKAEPSKEE